MSNCPSVSTRIRRPNQAGSIQSRKQIDWVQTLENYEIRISNYPKDFFLELNESYLSDYMKFCNSSFSHIPILEKICISHDIHTLGHIYENKKNNSYVYLPKNFLENAKVIYVGQANHITGQKESRFAVSKQDIIKK